MEIRARVASRAGAHEVAVETNGMVRAIDVPPKAEGAGSSVNGGELLFLALATCYGNDLYREAAAAGLRVDRVVVDVRGLFGGRGEPARDITYSVRVESPEPPERIEALIRETDRVTEIQNTLRQGVPVQLGEVRIATSSGGSEAGVSPR